MASKLIRLPEVADRTGLCRSAIYAQIQKGTFPQQIQINERTVAWDEEEIEEWIQAVKNRRPKS